MTVHFNNISDGVGLSAKGASGAAGHDGFYRRGFKRAFDLAIVVLTLPFSFTVMFVFAALVALDGHNPFYSQERVGKGGRIFRIWKLRSMVPDAEGRLASYLAVNRNARLEWESVQKLKNDPRITQLGRFIRRSSVDELPQLLNVLIGDMSLVGPRPMMPSQRSMYPDEAYFQMRPGITGYWQISDRNEGTFSGRAAFDTRYFNEMSLRTDLSIMASTVGVVLRCTGY